MYKLIRDTKDILMKLIFIIARSSSKAVTNKSNKDTVTPTMLNKAEAKQKAIKKQNSQRTVL